MLRLLVSLAALCLPLLAQQKQVYGGIDMQGPFSPPRGSSLPGVCTKGQMYWLDGAVAGQNLHLCTATNTWTQLTGTGGSDPDAAITKSFTFGSSQYWKITAAEQGFSNCNVVVLASISNELADPSRISCNPSSSPATVDGQTLAQYDILVSWPSNQTGSVLVIGGGSTAGYSFSSTQYWVVTAATHGQSTCALTIRAYLGNDLAEPSRTRCNPASSSEVVDGQTLGQYDVLVSWPSTQTGRVTISR